MVFYFVSACSRDQNVLICGFAALGLRKLSMNFIAALSKIR